MKIYTKCAVCEGDPTIELESTIVKVSPQDDSIYNIECSNGHKTKVYSGLKKFELLVDMGVIAFREGYLREAVLNFTSAFERFLEYSVLVYVSARGINIKEYNKYWKDVKNQSERQLGAYYALYLAEHGKTNPVDSDQAGFRNRVVHKGHIPSEKQSLDYMSYIYKFIVEAYLELKNDHQNVIDEIEHAIYKEKVPLVNDVDLWGIDAQVFKYNGEYGYDKTLNDVLSRLDSEGYIVTAG